MVKDGWQSEQKAVVLVTDDMCVAYKYLYIPMPLRKALNEYLSYIYDEFHAPSHGILSPVVVHFVLSIKPPPITFLLEISISPTLNCFQYF